MKATTTQYGKLYITVRLRSNRTSHMYTSLIGNIEIDYSLQKLTLRNILLLDVRNASKISNNGRIY